ncbi:MAG: hypothetical protein ACLTDV_01660 [Eubacterium sp.]
MVFQTADTKAGFSKSLLRGWESMGQSADSSGAGIAVSAILGGVAEATIIYAAKGVTMRIE